MRYKPYFVDKFKPKIRFPRNAKRQTRKQRLKLKGSRLKARRIKNVDSKMKRALTSVLLFSSIASYIYPPLGLISITILAIIFIAATVNSLVDKNEKQYEVL